MPLIFFNCLHRIELLLSLLFALLSETLSSRRTGGVTLPQALAEMGLIDQYELVLHPKLVGHGPTLFAGISKYVNLKLVSREEFSSGAVAMRYVPR